MEDVVRGALVGIAVGGFVAAVVEANTFALRTLLSFNFLAAEAVGCMFKGFYNDFEERRRQRRQQLVENQRRRQQWLAETETETESESETES